MLFDPENHVMQLCAHGMHLEGEGKSEEAYQCFGQAWNASTNSLEKFTSAHYVARGQPTVTDKLTWDTIALAQALTIHDERIKGTLPSLYLNIGKGYEDLQDFDQAREHYRLALSLADYLPPDGYGKMIKAGIIRGLERVTQSV